MANLRRVADAVGRWAGLMEALPIRSLWTYGELLEPEVRTLDVAQVALVVDLPAEEVSWMALPPAAVGFAGAAGLEKLPVARVWRPEVWPVWNHAIRRPVRIWGSGGPDQEAMASLASGEGIADFRLPEPTPEVYREQLHTELAATLVHLRQVTDAYWEREWRADHKGFGIHPDDHLWRAAVGFLELRKAAATAGIISDPDER